VALRPAATASVAAPASAAVSTVSAGQPVPDLPPSGRQFPPLGVGWAFPDGWAGGWAPGRVEPDSPRLGWHDKVSGAAHSGLRPV